MVTWFFYGFGAGCLILFIIHIWMSHVYQNILYKKSIDRSAECIFGEFFVIVPEKEYVRLLMRENELRAQEKNPRV